MKGIVKGEIITPFLLLTIVSLSGASPPGFPHVVYGCVDYPNGTPAIGAWMEIYYNNTSAGVNCYLNDTTSTSAYCDGYWQVDIGECPTHWDGDTIQINASMNFTDWYNETSAVLLEGVSTQAAPNMTLQIAPKISIIREQSNVSGTNSEMTVRFFIYNNGNATLPALNVTLNETFNSSWTITDNGTGVNTSSYIRWELGSIPADEYMMIYYKIRSAGEWVYQFEANVTYNYTYNESIAIYNESLINTSNVSVEPDRAFFEFELDLDNSTPEINRTISNTTDCQASWWIKNIGNANISEMPEPTIARFLYNRSIWNISSPQCSKPDCSCEIIQLGGKGAINCSIPSLNVSEEIIVNFSINTSYGKFDEIARSNASYDPPPGWRRETKEKGEGERIFLFEIKLPNIDFGDILDLIIMRVKAQPPGVYRVYGYVNYHNGSPAGGVFVELYLLNSTPCYLNDTTWTDGNWSVNLGDCPGWWDGDEMEINATLGESYDEIKDSVNSTGEGEPQQVANMTLNIAPNVTLISPPNGSFISDRTPTFIWNSTDNDTDPWDTLNNTLYLDTTPDFSNASGDLLVYTDILGNGTLSYTIPSSDALKNITKWYWMVSVNDSYVKNATNSTVFNFTLQKVYVVSMEDAFMRVRSDFPACVVCSISLASSFQSINWTITQLPQDNLSAEGNNDSAIPPLTNYSVNLTGTVGCLVDVYMIADGDLINEGGDAINLSYERFRNNTTDATVPGTLRNLSNTTWLPIGYSLSSADRVYLKFYLSVPSGQQPGNYTNNVTIRGVREGESP